MKNYALVGHFDELTENLIIDIWKELKDKGISDYGFVYKDRVPHITFIDLKAKSNNDLENILCTTVLKPIDIEINTIGNFMGSKTLFYGITFNEYLRDVHDTLRIMFRDYVPYDSIYLKNKWVPHTTIASRLSDDDMLKTFEIAKNMKFIDSKIVKLVLLEIKENSEVQVVEELELREPIDTSEIMSRFSRIFRTD